MKKLAVLMLVAIVGISFSFTTKKPSDDGIKFESITVAEAMAQAKVSGKLIFIDCYTDWCGPCKTMARTAFKEKEVGDVFNAQFINVKVEMEKDAEGPEMTRKYQIQGYPTLLVIDSNGKVVKKLVGGQNGAGLLRLANSVKIDKLSNEKN